MFTWNGKNNTESVEYEMKKKKKKEDCTIVQYLRQLVGVRYCGIFLPGNNNNNNINNNNNTINNNINNINNKDLSQPLQWPTRACLNWLV